VDPGPHLFSIFVYWSENMFLIELFCDGPIKKAHHKRKKKKLWQPTINSKNHLKCNVWFQVFLKCHQSYFSNDKFSQWSDDFWDV